MQEPQPKYVLVSDAVWFYLQALVCSSLIFGGTVLGSGAGWNLQKSSSNSRNLLSSWLVHDLSRTMHLFSAVPLNKAACYIYAWLCSCMSSPVNKVRTSAHLQHWEGGWAEDGSKLPMLLYSRLLIKEWVILCFPVLCLVWNLTKSFLLF